MKRRGKRKKAANRRIQAKTQSQKEGELKEEISNPQKLKKRLEDFRPKSGSLSVASKKVLREEAESSRPSTGFSDFFRNKHEDNPLFANLPTDPEMARKYARNYLKGKPKKQVTYCEQ